MLCQYTNYQKRCKFLSCDREPKEQQQKHQQDQQNGAIMMKTTIEKNNSCDDNQQQGFDYTGKYFYVLENNASNISYGYSHMCQDEIQECKYCQRDIYLHTIYQKDKPKLSCDQETLTQSKTTFRTKVILHLVYISIITFQNIFGHSDCSTWNKRFFKYKTSSYLDTTVRIVQTSLVVRSNQQSNPVS